VASRIADRMKQQALTPREADILRHMMLGMSNKAIASKLTLAVGTVKTHVKSVLEKLNASSRTQAVSIAQRRGILRDEVAAGANLAAENNLAAEQRQYAAHVLERRDVWDSGEVQIPYRNVGALARLE
jgi:DNA-binding CsgD family transcriptional regulator